MTEKPHTATRGPNAMRRAMLTAGPALALAPAAALAGEPATPDTPIERLFWQWCNTSDAREFYPQGGMSDQEYDDEMNRYCEVEYQIEAQAFAIPAQNERDLILKIYMAAVTHNFDNCPDISRMGDEIRSMVGTTDRHEAHERLHEERQAARIAREASA